MLKSSVLTVEYDLIIINISVMDVTTPDPSEACLCVFLSVCVAGGGGFCISYILRTIIIILKTKRGFL